MNVNVDDIHSYIHTSLLPPTAFVSTKSIICLSMYIRKATRHRILCILLIKFKKIYWVKYVNL